MKQISFFFILIIVFINSCSTPRPRGKTEAEVLYREAQEFVEDGRYRLATEKLNQIRSKYPYSYYATFAELLGADVLYKQDNFTEAAAAYIVFRDFHPRHRKGAYVLWRIGESFYHQIPSTFDRDLSAAHEAIRYFKELKRTYGASEYLEKASKRIANCEAMIRNKQQYIADFYYKTEVFDAARFRYRGIINEFEEPKMRAHAMIRAILSSANLGDKDFCRQKKAPYEKMIGKEFLDRLGQAYTECLNSEVVMKTE